MSLNKITPTCSDCPLCKPGLSCPYRDRPKLTDETCAVMFSHLQNYRTMKYVNSLHEADLKAHQILLKAATK